MEEKLKYKRILLKLSGEALLGKQEFGIDQIPLEMIANEIKEAYNARAEIAIVVGGGNIFRGSAIDINKIAEPYIRFKAIRHLEKSRVVIFAAGTGNPFFTTDTAAALRASEIGAEAMLMAKNGVDGVYSDDPRINPNSKKYESITYDDIIVKGLKVMDTASCALCKQNSIPIVVFDFAAKGSIIKILKGDNIGTYVGG